MDASETGIARRLTVVLLFFILSATSIVFSAYLLMHAYGLLFYAIAISFTALALISCVFNTMTAYTYYKSYFYTAYFNKLTASLKPMKGYPSVAVVMPVYNEDPEMFGKNLHRLRDLEYDKSKLTFYVLDDSTKPDVRERIERISRDNKAVYIHRSDRKGFKAGALNNMLKHSKEEFVAIFDADEYLTNTRFLLDLLPYFQNKEVAFAQTEKSYRRNGSLFTDSVNLFDALFFKFMQPSRAQHGTAIFAGSCGIIRHSAIDAVGGFPEYVTEDAFFSFESDMNNFKSVYVPRVYALGRPITFSELTTQQWRYNYGDTQFLMYFLRRMKNAKKGDAPFLSKLDYFAYGFGLNYLSSVLILFTILAIITVFSAAPFAYASLTMLIDAPQAIFYLELLGILAFVLSLMVPVVLTWAYFDSMSEGLMLFVLNFAIAFSRLKGGVAALMGSVPGKGWFKAGSKGDDSKRLMPAFRMSATELVFSSAILISSAFAILASNLTGFLWLLWYGILYSSAFFFYYKYG